METGDLKEIYIELKLVKGYMVTWIKRKLQSNLPVN